MVSGPSATKRPTMLNDTQIRSLKPASRPFKKSDSGGLHIIVQPTGAKLWKLAYRIEDKQKTLSGGTYPATSLAQARKWRDDAKEMLEKGRDPGEAKKGGEAGGAGGKR